MLDDGRTMDERIVEALSKSRPRPPRMHCSESQLDDWHGMVNQYNHTVYELWQESVIDEATYLRFLVTKG